MSSTTPGSDSERRPGADADFDARADDELPTPPEPVEPVEPMQSAGPAEPAESAEPSGSPEPAVSAEPFESPEPSAPAESEAERLDPTARLDAAVQRANAMPMVSDEATATELREPVPAAPDRGDAYAPAMAGAAAGAAAPAPETSYVAPQPGPQTVYVQAPPPPRTKGNRGFGVLVALIGTVAFALLYAGVAYLILLGRGDAAEATDALVAFLLSLVFWVPVVGFFVGFALLAVIVNRGAWWYYAVFGLLVAVFVYFAYVGGAVLHVQVWRLPVGDSAGFLGDRWLDPFAIAAFVIAREIPIWFGGWLAARGRAVTERNRLAREAYERELAAGPQPVRS